MTEEELHAWCNNNGGHEISTLHSSYGLVLYDKTYCSVKFCTKCNWQDEVKVIKSTGQYIGPIIIPKVY